MMIDTGWFRFRRRDAEIVRRYLDGQTPAEIAADKSFGLATGGVRSVLARRGINKRSAGRPPRITAEEIAEYREAGWSTKMIARAKGMKEQSIRAAECRSRKKGLTHDDTVFT